MALKWSRWKCNYNYYETTITVQAATFICTLETQNVNNCNQQSHILKLTMQCLWRLESQMIIHSC